MVDLGKAGRYKAPAMPAVHPGSSDEQSPTMASTQCCRREACFMAWGFSPYVMQFSTDPWVVRYMEDTCV